jgi:hypothetical protein
VKSLGESPAPVVIKKDDEPLSYELMLKREGAYVNTKEETRVPSLNTGALVYVLDEQNRVKEENIYN